MFCIIELLQGFLPTLLEDIPDMAVKFAVYETLRNVLTNFNGGRQVRVDASFTANGMLLTLSLTSLVWACQATVHLHPGQCCTLNHVIELRHCLLCCFDHSQAQLRTCSWAALLALQQLLPPHL